MPDRRTESTQFLADPIREYVDSEILEILHCAAGFSSITLIPPPNFSIQVTDCTPPPPPDFWDRLVEEDDT